MAHLYKILAIDDEKFNLTLLEACLKDQNYFIRGFTEPLSAVGELKKNNFDVILLDVMLGPVNGFDIRKIIREINPKIPIIFLTSLVDDINSSLLTKISDDQYSYYMNKAFDHNELIRRIEQVGSSYRKLIEADDFYRQIENDLNLAGEVQSIMLPRWCFQDSSLIGSFLYIPKFRVSGDVFEYFRLTDDKFFVLLGDISGHGVQAALCMSAIKSFMKMLISESTIDELVPHVVLNRMNRFFIDELAGEHYMTVLIGIFDTQNNKFTFQSAGHPMFLCYSPAAKEIKDINPWKKGGMPVGWRFNFEYVKDDNVEYAFNDDDIFMGYTDGLLELCKNNDDAVDNELFARLFSEIALEDSFFSLPYKLMNFLSQIGYERANDDITLAVFRKNKIADTVAIEIISLDMEQISKSIVSLYDFALEHTGNEALSTKIELLLSEFLNNIVFHGYKNRKNTHAVAAVQLEVINNLIKLTVFDRGQPYKISEYATLEDCNEQLTANGRGLAIIQSIAETIQRKHYSGLNETVFYVK